MSIQNVFLNLVQVGDTGLVILPVCSLVNLSLRH